MQKNTDYKYVVKDAVNENSEPLFVGNSRTLSGGDKFNFAVAGDSQSNPKQWEKTASAILDYKPEFLVHLGDIVGNGGNDSEWDEYFFGPAAKLLSNVPIYAVMGNHYPAWSAGNYWHEKDGVLRDKSARTARNIILSLLNKYNATAMFTGHVHVYERSEFGDKGVTQIISGGAAEGLGKKVKNAKAQNPYSKAIAPKHHYCQVSIDGDTCTMRAVTPEVEVLDTRTWEARK